MAGPVFRIRILVFLAVAFKMGQQKLSFFAYFLPYCTVGTLKSVFKDNMSLRSHNTVEIMIYRTIFA
jgi:hypothetical protein